MNQLYRHPEKQVIEGNPDLQAIRIASVNAILDPWIYILLRKTVLQKLLEKVKCLFCRMGGRGRGPGLGDFRCGAGMNLSSVISRDSPTLVPRELRDVVSTSQTYLYPPDMIDGHGGSIRLSRTYPSSTEQGLLQDPQGSDPSIGQSADGRTTGKDSQLKGTHSAVRFQSSRSPQGCKQQTLQVTFTDETLNLQERCIWRFWCMLANQQKLNC